MNIKRILGITLVLYAIAVFAVPVSGLAAEKHNDLSVYFRPAVRFGTDDRTLFIMDFLVPIYRGDKNIVFLNTKLTPDDLDGFEVNLGIGYRHLLLNDRLILGGNFFYDNRRTGWGTHWKQIGVGAEAMAEFNKYLALTGRFNYYIPLTDPRVSGAGGFVGLGTGYFFREQGIWTSGVIGGGSVEEAPEGFDGEVGYRIPVISDYVETWVYVGGYHYHGSHVGTIDGFSARIEIIPTDFVRLSYEYRNDRTTHGEHHGEVAFEVPFSVGNLCAGKNPFEGLGRRLKGSRGMKERMVEPVRRDADVRIVRGGNTGSGEPTDMMVEDVVFVSEDAEIIAGTPDGTFEHPFASITDAMAAIHSGGVYEGITTIHIMNDSVANTAGGGTASLASLMIWGSGMPHPIYGIITNQLSGNPTLADELILTGGTINVLGTTYAGSNGITVAGANANIHHNYFSGNDWGILVNSGSASITDNHIGGGGTGLSPMTRCGIYVDGGSISSISRNTIDTVSNGGGYGIYFYNLPSIGSTTISDNTISVSDTMGTIAAGIFFSTCGPISGVTITGNTIGVTSDIASYAYGIGATYGTGDYDLEIAGNSITVAGTANDARGISIEVPGGSITADIHDNGSITVSGSGDAYGINLVSLTDSITADIYDNGPITVTSGDSGNAFGISLETPGNSSSITTNIYENGPITVTGAAHAFGINVRAYNYVMFGPSTGGSVTANIRDNATITVTGLGYTTPMGIGGDACGINLEALDNIYASITGNDLSGGISGMGRSVPQDPSNPDQYRLNGVFGIRLFAANGNIAGIGTSDLLISNNNLGGNGVLATRSSGEADGIYLSAGGSLYARASNGGGIIGNTILSRESYSTNAFAYGIYADIMGDILATISGGSISATGPGATGIMLSSWGDLTADISVPTIDVTGTYATDNSFYRVAGIMLQANFGAMNMTITGMNVTVTAPHMWVRGIYAQADGDLTATITGGSIIASGLDSWGLGLESYNGNLYATISGLALNSSATGSTTNAYGAYLYAAGRITGTLSSTGVAATGGLYRYLLALESDLAGTGNSVNWSGISYTDPAGGWSGNYLSQGTTPLGPTVLTGTTYPIWTNFLTGDTIIDP